MKSILTVMSVLLFLLPCTLHAEYWLGDAGWPITNFSFEVYDEDTHLFNGWTFLDSDAEVEQDLAYSFHYTASAHIIKDTSSGNACLEQTLDHDPGIIFPNQPCYLIAFVKTKGVSSTGIGGLEARVTTHTKDPDITKEYSSNIIVDDHNWTKLIVPFDSIALDGIGDAITIRIGLFEAEGEAWIDAVQLIPRDVLISQDSAEIPDIKNPSFESYNNSNFDNWVKLTPVGVTITADPGNLVLGSKSAKFDFGTGGINRSASLAQSLTVPQQYRTYAFSGFIRTEGLQTSGTPPSALGAYCQVSYGGFTWSSQNYNLSNGWTEIQGVFQKPKGTSPSIPLFVRAQVSAKSGKAWFDWLTLRLNYVQNVEFNNWGATPPPDLVVWKKENISGTGTAGIDLTHGHHSSPCGIIDNNNDTNDTVLSQTLGLLRDDSSIDQMCLHEGGTYRLTGWVMTDSVVPNPVSAQPDAPPNGAFVELLAYSGWSDTTTLLARSECLTNDNDWNELSLVFSIPLDYFADEPDDIDTFNTIYYLRCRLHNASGTAYFDDVNLVELEPTEDLATVVPQPQAYQSFGYFSDPLVGFNPSKVVTIYYTPDSSPDPELGDTYQFSANNLQQELNRAFYECTGENPLSGYAGWEAIKYNYPIPASNIKKLDNTVTSLSKPCIILGDPSLDGSTGHLFKGELEKRGMVLPQDISREGYIMEIDQDTILIAASDSVILTRGNSDSALTKGAGSFYGTETLLQMLDIEQKSTTPINCPGGVTYLPNQVVAPAGYIYDYPDMVWRGQMSYITSGLTDSPPEQYPPLEQYPKWNTYDNTGFDLGFDNDVTVNKKLFAQQMAKFKMNRLQLFSTIFFFLNCKASNGVLNKVYMQSLFDYCRKLHIEPIPMLGDWNSALLRHNGNCLEYMIFDSQYIDNMGLTPGPNDYYSVEPGDRYPYPMPQPSWEFTVGNVINNYFANNTVNVWIKTPQGGYYDDVKTMDYRVYNEADFPVRVEVWNEEQNIWDPPLTNGYTLYNVGLNDGNTSYFRFHTEDAPVGSTGFYDWMDQADWAYITFDPSLNGRKVRVSYAAPINMGLILPNSAWGGDTPLPQKFSIYTCLSDFDQDLPTDPETEDIWENWTDWDSRDIWYVALYEMIDWLKPRYIDIQHCEMWVMHLDKRCQYLRGLIPNYPDEERYQVGMHTWEHNAWNYGHEIEYLRKTIAVLDNVLTGNAQMMLYADMLDRHNGNYGEGRCRWDWYDNNSPDEYHQPDSDDPNWVGNVASHIYYQPAMEGMGGWTWDTRPNPDGLTCDPRYGMMASRYVTVKDSIVCWEWGFQGGYFDDRDPENVITWQDKFEERYNNLKDQDFTNFVGGCAGYALALEGAEMGGIWFRCRDESAKIEGIAGIGGNNSSFIQLDGTNLKWVQMNYYVSDLQNPDPSLDIHMYLEVYNLDPKYAGTDHINPNYGTGCHLGMVQNGWGYADDMHVTMNGTYDLTPDIYNSLFEYDFPAAHDPHGEINWNPTFDAHDSWSLDNYNPNTGNHCCKFFMNDKLYEYSSVLKETTYNERHHVDQNKQPDTLNFSVYLRSLKLDALRHINVKTWMDLTYNYQPKDNILGMINTQWGNVRNYSSEPTSADWMWSRNYPASPLIKYMYYDPFYMFMGDKATHPDDTYPPNAPYPRDTESWTEP